MDTTFPHNRQEKETKAQTSAEQKAQLSRRDLKQPIYEQTNKYRDSERKFREMVERTSDLIVHLDRRGHLTFINRAVLQLFDIPPERYSRISLFRFIHPDDHERVLKWWNSCFVDRRSDTSLTVRHMNVKSDMSCTIKWSAAVLYDGSGKMTGINAIGRDISEARRFEQNYFNLFSKMLDGFALHEIICREGKPVDYRFLSINPAFETQTGLKADDLLGKTVRDIMPDIEQHWIDTYGRVALTGEPITFENYSHEIDKYFEVAAYCPAPNQFACIFQDITFRKKAEQEKARLETELRRRHKMEAVGTLAGGIAHDFNNILAAILGYADMALEEIPATSPAKTQIQEVLKAGHRAKDLVKQILAFSRQEGQYREPVQLKTLIEEVVAFLKATIPPAVHLKLDLAPNCGSILADQTQIHRVLMNICTNGIQSMEDQGGTLSIALREIPLTERDLDPAAHLMPGTYLMITISDTGMGIGKEYHDRIFDPYFTTKEFGKGSGMGLAVVHGIVKSHGGMIKFSSHLSKGTSFSTYFPITAEKTQPIKRPIVPYSADWERLLVVDDDPDLTVMLRKILERAGYTVDAFTNSRKALEAYLADPAGFDMIITDQNMPGMTGEQLALETLRVRPEIPVILCTGYSDHIDERKAAEAGIRAYLAKPVSMETLTETVRHVLDGGQPITRQSGTKAE
ncbi:MAG: response regulator [Desulforhopalus sp.]